MLLCSQNKPLVPAQSQLTPIITLIFLYIKIHFNSEVKTSIRVIMPVF
jgi:hypothetical protein